MQFNYRRLLNPFTITIFYLVIGGLWIQFSDDWLERITDDLVYLNQLQTYKGWFFVLITGGLLYFLISKHKKYVAESSFKIRESEKNFEHIFFFNPFPMVVLDSESDKILLRNKSFISTFSGGKRTEGILLSDILSEQSLPEVLKGLNTQTSNTTLGTFQALTNDHSTLIVEISAFQFSLDAQTTRLLIFNDVTVETKNREKVIELTQNLEKLIQERTVELRNINSELEAFSYSVSHDLRAPLRAIDGFSLAVIDEFGKTLDPIARNYLDRVRSASTKMSELIDDMTRLSKISRTNVEIKDINMTEICQQIAAEQRLIWGDKNYIIVIQNKMYIRTDIGLLRILLFNLISNAFKYSSRTENPSIEIGQTDDKTHPEFFVRDNGVGIDMQYADKIFKPFQRLHETADYPGTGVGLATVQRIINKLSGKIRIESKKGNGTTFYFNLNNDHI